MDSGTRPVSESAYGRLLRDGLSLTAATTAPRRHPVCFRDTVPAGFATGIALPRDLSAGGTWSVPIGPRPTAGTLSVVLGLTAPPPPGLALTLNGQPVGPPQPHHELKDLGGSPTHAVRYPCPPPAARDGHNQITLAPSPGAAGKVVWVEVRVGE
ncbi:MAG: hypothetical protein IT204_12210 [Fimbriimonadaceae bacterium]|nr:hypothetical protein [Fimbriimonadaceae bacterium]